MTAVDTFQLTPLRSTDPNVSSFKVETLQFHVTFSNTLQSLHMNVQAVPGKTDTNIHTFNTILKHCSTFYSSQNIKINYMYVNNVFYPVDQ